MDRKASRVIRALILGAAGSLMAGCITPGPVTPIQRASARSEAQAAPSKRDELDIARIDDEPVADEIAFYELAESYGLKVSIDLVTGRRVLRDGVNEVVIMPSSKAIEINRRRFPLASMIRWRQGVLYVPAEARVFLAEFLQSRPVPQITHAPELFDGSEPSLDERRQRTLPASARARPAATSSSQAASGGSLPKGWSIQSQRRWRYVVIHHSATDVGSAKSFDQSHRKRGWQNGLGYHFVIGNGTTTPDGHVEVGPRWLRQNEGIDGAHAGNKQYNKFGIGICLVGNYNSGRPTPRQLVALRRLCRALMTKYGIQRSSVFPHSEVRRGHTDCPGKAFPLDAFRKSL